MHRKYVWRRLTAVLLLTCSLVVLFHIFHAFKSFSGSREHYDDKEKQTFAASPWIPYGADQYSKPFKLASSTKVGLLTYLENTTRKKNLSETYFENKILPKVSTPKGNKISLDCIRSVKHLLHQGHEFNISRKEDVLPVCRKVSYEKLKTFTAHRHNFAVVPNIAHYVWFGQQTFRFDHLVSLLSAYKIMRADKIMFHTDSEPVGKYWDEALRTIPTLQIIHRDQPRSNFGHDFKKSKIQHKSDMARLEILMQHGGVYMDNDVIVVKSLEPLRHFNFVMGRESETRLNNGIIIANKDSKFLKWYYRGYRFYTRRSWNCDSILYPNALAIQYPELIHIEDDSLVKPNWHDCWQIFVGHYRWWEGHYTIHTFIRNFYLSPENRDKEINYTPENIKLLKSAFGEICRFIYYGNKEIIKG